MTAKWQYKEAYEAALVTARELRAENAKLREDLEFERSENGWAREFLDRMGQKCGTKDCPSLVSYVTKMEADNAKLRELVADALLSTKDYAEKYGGPSNAFDASDWRIVHLRSRGRELGVEVD